MAVDRGVAIVHRITHCIAAGQRTPGPVRSPAANALAVLPFPPAGIARAVIHLIDRLRPAAVAQPLGHFHPLPGVGPGIGEYPFGFVFPILTPVLDDEFLAAMFGNQQVLQHDLRARILDHTNRFVPTGNLALERFVAFQPRGGFLHIEAHLVIARHAQDRLAVAFKMRFFRRLAAILNRTIGKCRSSDKRTGQQRRANEILYSRHDRFFPRCQNWKLSDTLALRPGRV